MNLEWYRVFYAGLGLEVMKAADKKYENEGNIISMLSRVLGAARPVNNKCELDP